MKQLKRALFFIMISVLTFGAGLGLFHHLGIFRVAGIPVEVVDGVDSALMRRSPGASQDLQARLKNKLAAFNQLKIWEVSLGQIQAAVMRDEWVKEVRISRALPNEIRVLVKPRTPVFVWLAGHIADEKNTDKQVLMRPVAEDGRLMEPLPADKLPDVAILRGARFEKDEVLRKKAIQFMLSLPESGSGLNRRNISEMSWTPEEGFTLMLSDPHVTVKLGDDQLELKVMRVSQVFGYLSTNHLRGRVIDASFSKKVLVRLRKGP